MPTYTSIRAADADESLSIAGTAVTLTLPAYFTATAAGGVNHGRVVITINSGGPMLFTTNGTAPTDSGDTTGERVNIGDTLYVTTLQEMRDLKMIRATGATAVGFARYEARTA